MQKIATRMKILAINLLQFLLFFIVGILFLVLLEFCENIINAMTSDMPKTLILIGPEIKKAIKDSLEMGKLLYAGMLSPLFMITYKLIKLEKLADNTDKYSEKITNVSRNLTVIGEDIREPLTQMSTLISRLLGVDLLKSDDQYKAALNYALTLNSFSWIKNISVFDKHYFVFNPFPKALLLSIMTTYYREEIYDINRLELATNGRNFCHLLLTITSSFIDFVNDSDDYEFHYYSITPVSPINWYRWPIEQEKYGEEAFISFYYRSIMEIVSQQKAKASENFIHKRYVLVRENNCNSKKDLKGWPLSKLSDFRNDLNQFIYNLPINNPDPNDFEYQLAENAKYAIRITSVNPSNRSTPTIDSTFAQKSLESHKLTLKKLKKNVLNSVSEHKATKEVCTKIKIIDEFDVDCTRFNYFQLADALHTVDSYVQNPENNTSENSICQEYLEQILRYRASKNVGAEWKKVGLLFTETLHTKKEHAHYTELSQDCINNWLVNENEFALFGLKKKGDDEITWIMGICTDVKPPFNTALIRLIIEPQKLKQYVDQYTRIKNNSKKIMDLLNE